MAHPNPNTIVSTLIEDTVGGVIGQRDEGGWRYATQYGIMLIHSTDGSYTNMLPQLFTVASDAKAYAEEALAVDFVVVQVKVQTCEVTFS